MNFLSEILGLHNHDCIITYMSYARILIPLIIGIISLHVLIIKPQKLQQKQGALITQKLIPGAIITTNEVEGVVLCILEHSVIIERYDGEKIEVLKQTITKIT